MTHEIDDGSALRRRCRLCAMNPRRLVPSLVLVLASAAFAAPIPPESFSALHWRSIGPLRAGWVTATDGIPGTDTFYMGTADGGVWRTTDAGRSWKPLFDHEDAAAVGALEVIPGDPSILY